MQALAPIAQRLVLVYSFTQERLSLAGKNLGSADSLLLAVEFHRELAPSRSFAGL